MIRASSRYAAAILVLAVAEAHGQTLRDRMLAAEDARATSTSEMAPLLQGLRANDAKIVVQAVRALGRLERPSLVPQLLPFVTHPRPEVRAEAINALGQALAGREPPGSELSTVSKTLVARLKAEADPYVIGVAAETLGRLPFATAESVTAAENALATLLPIAEGAAPVRPGTEAVARVVHPASVTGALRGLDTRVRVHQKLTPLQPATIARIRAAATLGSDPSDEDLASLRRVAWVALNDARAADLPLVDRGFEDPDPQARRLAVVALGYIDAPVAARAERVRRALRDPSYIVRYESVRMYNRIAQATSCEPLLAALADHSAHVALAAIDALGEGCPAGPSPISTLIQTTDSISRTGADWHRPAHALLSLARVARDHAATRLARFSDHPAWQVRMYAARAAAAMVAENTLGRLAVDRHDNVREAALTGLLAVRGHNADAQYIASLARSDYQLVLTAANALKGTPHPDRAVPELIKAFDRITAERRDTSRDPRLAILERLQELGDKRHAAALQSCVADFDPMVAARCAAMLSTWTGVSHTARPALRPMAPVAFTAARRVRITMQRGGAFDLGLFGDDARVTVARFVDLARKGYYNGLTFHRVVPNFVLQGGSPGANEYMGDGPFMRDELGLRTHARGTLGISTRGRDTGDAQIFINLVDNPRLDHNYTVFAAVATGMDVVDGILEGDVIERIDVLEAASTQSGR